MKKKKVVFSVILSNLSNRVIDVIKGFTQKNEDEESAEQIKDSISTEINNPVLDTVKDILDRVSVLENNNKLIKKTIIDDIAPYIVNDILGKDMQILFDNMSLVNIYYDGDFAHFTFE